MDPRALQHAATIEDLQRGLADVAVDALLEADPTVEARYGDIARRTWRTEGEARMAHLAQSVACGRPGIYAGHVAGVDPGPPAGHRLRQVRHARLAL
ncbi:MAG: hypothetical protein ACKOHI_03000, partial [Phycisphaerales bacterium]